MVTDKPNGVVEVINSTIESTDIKIGRRKFNLIKDLKTGQYFLVSYRGTTTAILTQMSWYQEVLQQAIDAVYSNR